MKTTIMVVDDHSNVRRMVSEYLAELGYSVVGARDGEEALMLAQRHQPDLVLLDVMMPNLDGFAFLRAFRRERRTPVILLTARLAESDKVVGLDLGADDYVTKPFGMQELAARIRSVLRRTSEPMAAEIVELGDLVLNTTHYRVTVGGQIVGLTRSEFTLLATLIRAPGRVFSRDQLLAELQGNDYEGVERTVDVHIRNLRKKIEPNAAQPRFVRTVFGIGYRAATADELHEEPGS